MRRSADIEVLALAIKEGCRTIADAILELSCSIDRAFNNSSHMPHKSMADAVDRLSESISNSGNEGEIERGFSELSKAVKKGLSALVFDVARILRGEAEE